MHYNCNLFIVEVLHYYCRNSLCTIIASYLLKYCTIIAVFFSHVCICTYNNCSELNKLSK